MQEVKANSRNTIKPASFEFYALRSASFVPLQSRKSAWPGVWHKYELHNLNFPSYSIWNILYIIDTKCMFKGQIKTQRCTLIRFPLTHKVNTYNNNELLMIFSRKQSKYLLRNLYESNLFSISALHENLNMLVR